MVAEHHGARDALECHPQRGDLQRADHHRAHSARITRREIPPDGVERILRRNLLVYGGGGVLLPFVGIKLIDVLVNVLHLA